MKPELIIFDMDGLMFDTERIYYKAWQEAAKQQGYTLDWDVYVQIVARNSAYIEKVLKQIFGEAFPYEVVVTEKRRLSDAQIMAEGIRIKEGLYELLDVLEAAGIKKAVATSSMKTKALNYLDLGKVKERFDTIICGSEVAESKPNPEIFLKVAQRLGVAPKQCWVLEDSRLGIESAKAAGMFPILIPDLVTPDEEMTQNAGIIMASLHEVITYLAL